GGSAAVCRIASPTAMAAAIATLSERKPFRIGMTSRASAAACTFSGTPEVSRPKQQHVAGPERMREIRAAPTRGEENEPCAGAGAPRFERFPAGVTHDLDLIEVIHAGAAERAVAGGKARGLDDVRLEAEAGGETKNRARVLGNVGLKQRNAHGPS